MCLLGGFLKSPRLAWPSLYKTSLCITMQPAWYITCNIFPVCRQTGWIHFATCNTHSPRRLPGSAYCNDSLSLHSQSLRKHLLLDSDTSSRQLLRLRFAAPVRSPLRHLQPLTTPRSFTGRRCMSVENLKKKTGASARSFSRREQSGSCAVRAAGRPVHGQLG